MSTMTDHARQRISDQLARQADDLPLFILVAGKPGERELRALMREFPGVAYRCWRLNATQQANMPQVAADLKALADAIDGAVEPLRLVVVPEGRGGSRALYRAFLATRYPGVELAIAVLSAPDFFEFRRLSAFDREQAIAFAQAFTQEAP